jgi:hypothetical protein
MTIQDRLRTAIKAIRAKRAAASVAPPVADHQSSDVGTGHMVLINNLLSEHHGKTGVVVNDVPGNFGEMHGSKNGKLPKKVVHVRHQDGSFANHFTHTLIRAAGGPGSGITGHVTAKDKFPSGKNVSVHTVNDSVMKKESDHTSMTAAFAHAHALHASGAHDEVHVHVGGGLFQKVLDSGSQNMRNRGDLIKRGIRHAGGPGSGITGHTTEHPSGKSGSQRLQEARNIIKTSGAGAYVDKTTKGHSVKPVNTDQLGKKGDAALRQKLASLADMVTTQPGIYKSDRYHFYGTHGPRNAGGPGSGITGHHTEHADASYTPSAAGLMDKTGSYKAGAKDHARIKDIITRAKGDETKAHKLAQVMANSIDKPDKAARRADAAKKAGYHGVAHIFSNRHKELTGRYAAGRAAGGPGSGTKGHRTPVGRLVSIATIKLPTRPPAVSKSLTDAVSQMKPDEKDALTLSFNQAAKSGFMGDANAFLATQAALYSFAKEGDPRLTTWLSGDTLDSISNSPAGKYVADLATSMQQQDPQQNVAVDRPQPAQSDQGGQGGQGGQGDQSDRRLAGQLRINLPGSSFHGTSGFISRTLAGVAEVVDENGAAIGFFPESTLQVRAAS